MSAAAARRAPKERVVLGELSFKDLNAPRDFWQREPIVFDQENEEAVLEGVRLGVYDFDEIMELTNSRGSLSPATTRDQDSSDDDVSGFTAGEMSDEELVEQYAEDDDELLGDAMTEELGEEMADDDQDIDSDDELQGPVFDPAALGLKEINNLAHFSVSSHRPGNGVAELLSEDLDKYWQ